MIGQRSAAKVAQALVAPQHYRALVNMWRVYPRFADNLSRYLTGRGSYPLDVTVRTPTAPLTIRLSSYHDLLTVNEIFCRIDYPADASLRYVLDLGSNVGISALYFLSRNAETHCILYEPDPQNVQRLRHNLRGFEGRYSLVEAAVADRSGVVEFGVEESGRYGGIGVPTGRTITVQCTHVNDVLRHALARFPHIDIMKIDTEGVEVATVQAIDSELLPKINHIYLEANPAGPLHGEWFRNQQLGSVRRLTRRALQGLRQA